VRDRPEPMESGAPDEPATVLTAAPASAAPVADRAPAGPVPAAQPIAPPPAPRRARLWWRILRVILLVILLPVIALGIGLLIAYVAHQIRGNASSSTRTVPLPSASASPSASPTPSAAPSAQVVVPADWIAEVSPPAGLTFRHPPGWIRRTESPEVLRFAPASSGSQSPGIEGVGAGFETATVPAEALQSFAARAYGSQPGFVGGAVTPVQGAHPDETQELVTYNRSGVGVRVVLRSFRLQGHTVLIVGRSLNTQPARALQLASQVEASLAFGS
jgi:hypothetical protein